MNLDERRRIALSQVESKKKRYTNVMFLLWAAAGGNPMATEARSDVIGQLSLKGSQKRRGYSPPQEKGALLNNTMINGGLTELKGIITKQVH